jgi:hypothetical protein
MMAPAIEACRAVVIDAVVAQVARNWNETES